MHLSLALLSKNKKSFNIMENTSVDESIDVTRVPFSSLLRECPGRSRLPFSNCTLYRDRMVVSRCLKRDEDQETFQCPTMGTLIDYLDSDDTRLPPHPLLQLVKRCDPQEYNVYTGEEVWESASAHQEEMNAEQVDAAAVATFVDFFLVPSIAALMNVDFHCAGVVLRGYSCVADDASWAVSSQSVWVTNVRDVFHLLRMSTKFLEDVSAQRADKREHNNEDAISMALTCGVEHFPSAEFRAFVSYPLDVSRSAVVLGLSQRSLDVCYPELAELYTEHDNAQQSALTKTLMASVERLLKAYLSPSSDLVSWLTSLFGRSDGTDTEVIVSFDILFESSSLPVWLLSASCVGPSTKWGTTIHPTSFFRLFRSKESLLQRSHPHLLIALDASDLCGDGSHFASRVPLEFQCGEVPSVPPEVAAMFERIRGTS
jgi:hypothetical protein